MPSNTATINNLTDQMYQNKEVLQGWDAALSLLASALDAFFLQQWQGMTGGAGRMRVASVWCEGVYPIPGNLGYYTNVRCFRTELGPPLFTFSGGQSQVSVRQNILAGSLQIGTMGVPANFNPATANCTPNDVRVNWSDPDQIQVGNNPYISGSVALSDVSGFVNATSRSVVLDFAKGAFTLNRLNVTAVSAPDLVNALKNWFATQRITYCLASVDMRSVSSAPGLTPRAFRFHVLTTNSGNIIVQLLISTTGNLPSSTGILVSEPIPTADGMTCSLIVSSRLLYQQILIPGVNIGGQFSLYSVQDGGAGNAFYARLTPQMRFSGSFSYGNCCNRTTVTYNINLSLDFKGSARQGFSVSQHVQTSGSAPVSIDVSGSYPVVLSGSGMGQTLTISPGPISVNVSGSVEGQIKSMLQDILQNNVRNAMARASFAPVSLLALQSLLFPGHFISMRQAQVPAGLLVVGTFGAK